MAIVAKIYHRLVAMSAATRLSSRWRDWPALWIFGLARYRSFAESDLISRVGRRCFPLLRVRTDRLGYIGVLLKPTDTTHFAIFDEVVLEDVYDLSLVPFLPDKVVDCGGHIGLFTARAASYFPSASLTVFEPMPKNASILRQMVSQNALLVDIQQSAVSDKECTTTFYERMSYGGSLRSGDCEVSDTYEVHVADLLAVARTWPPCTRLLLKVDIEGEEENLLPKLIPLLPTETAMFFETHRGTVGWAKIVRELNIWGFDAKLLRARNEFCDGFAKRRV